LLQNYQQHIYIFHILVPAYFLVSLSQRINWYDPIT
jgi:hypothetical protein